MNIHCDGKVSLPFDENQSVGVRKAGLKHALQQPSDGGFPTKSKGLGGSVKKKQRKALGDVTESQINSRKYTSSSNPKGSKLTVSVTKASSKQSGPKIFVEPDVPAPLPTDDMTCSGKSSEQRDLYTVVELAAAKKSASATPGLVFPPKSVGARREASGRPDFSAEAAAILNDSCEELEDLPATSLSVPGSFLADIFDDQAINDLLSD
mmetsp:Transcript_25772/g.43441  ORF Transcript_25772/g.43441 Transcript_25772/m.43441 type:complete len:208 (-) Transcript_25772:197-820(-)|eukprot:CAMPEP_0114435742 /NCGR_PEP_ID=MMETSP0103-20121206/13017_1 /TAXON_ID=37642 ORGANISM="Paraphysomonas imperforata, Strain PA2" /NCGR_SAMPLE_ID=MMETSP0103 /ASSEMBLY_ACC=CAM_ASM_000201 /LENGTH=207 /DNA_ID=CAMNT_0001605837 /DNA_START=81 /DNA_END=704 /DNA_ORIENTATION=-